MAADTRVITATIARVNGHGFTTREQPQTWLNLSKYAKPAPTIPPTGTEVRLTLDGDGYVRAIEPMASAHEPTPTHTDQHTSPPPGDTSIVRMAALKCAVRLSQAGAPTDGVLALAARLEAWINR